jgi:adenosylcobyric acid synthase
MLGQSIADPLGAEGRQQTVPGLGFLDIETVLTDTKRLAEASGIELATGIPVAGYEMHLGETTGPGLQRPMLRLAGGPDGCVSADGLVAGCYMHGLFTSDPFRREYLGRLGAEPGAIAYEHNIETTLDALAEHLVRSLDLSALLAAARPPRLRRAA